MSAAFRSNTVSRPWLMYPETTMAVVSLVSVDTEIMTEALDAFATCCNERVL
jgi:hypothetical protein